MKFDEDVAEWMRFAKTDFDVAKNSDETMHPKPLEVICYLCQQSAEKALKAFLIAKEIDPPKIHDLDTLREMCEGFEQSFAETEKHCEFLTKYAVAPKYPSHGLDIIESDARIALKYAQIVYEKVESCLLTVGEFRTEKEQ